ncbi:UDP-N-acetylglucosamine 2-epimerase [Thermococcus piezophilus]|uniref:UDP-N-acetylglucosamine 2-epimerase n=1 Tax=Thermococcus piezophilus TaxID=1712654 RepID=UPI002D21D55E|nr:UDP-N-acetylglucosamine 2-epimerase [Thermococcus piezophilus]
MTLRDRTEWVETIEDGWNVLVGANKEKILKAIKELNQTEKHAHTNSATERQEKG